MLERVYLDTCCLNRPFDDQAQDRVRRESAAVLRILDEIQAGTVEWIGSVALLAEITRRPGGPPDGLKETLGYLTRVVTVGAAEEARALHLMSFGLGAMDALHLACAEHAGVHKFVTTDDRLLKGVGRAPEPIFVTALNPVDWVGRLMP